MLTRRRFATINLLLDVYTPVDNNSAGKPAVVLIHGGGFKSGDKTQLRLTDAGRYLVERGFVCFSINYRLRGDFPPADPNFVAMVLDQWPEKFDEARAAAVHAAFVDTKRAIRWVRANWKTYQIDPNHIFTLGSSAGAFCAITAAITDSNDFLTDLPTETPDPLNNPNESPAVQACVDLWGGANFTPGEFDPADPPIMILHGTDDPTVPFYLAEEIRDGCIAAGIPYEFYPIEGGGHGLWDVTVNGSTLEELVLAFFKKYVLDIPGDLNHNCSVNLSDFAILGSYWSEESCTEPQWCAGADLDQNAQVDFSDLSTLSTYWLECTTPECN